MPSVSDKQHRAMEAAKHGHSTLGIPQEVGAKFVAADAGKKEKPAALAKGGKIVDHGDHFKLHTAGGAVMTMAKNGLHSSTVKHLQSFAEGGEVKHYAEGGGPVANSPEEEADIRKMDADPDKFQEELEGRQTQREAQEANEAEDANADPTFPGHIGSNGEATKPSGFIGKTADTTHKLDAGPPGDVAPPVPPPGVDSDNVQLGKFVAAKVKDITPEEIAAKDAANAARTANTAEHERLAGEVGKAEDAKVKSLQDIEKSSNIHYEEIQGRAAKLRDEIVNGKIDPNHYWAEKGTGGRIAGTIGLLLSGLGSGLGGGPNMAMKVIQDNINRDIDAQEKNLDTKKSLLSDTYRETGDLRLARQIAEHTAMNVALAQMNKLAAQSSSADVKGRNEVASAVANESLAQSARGIADRRAANQASAVNANTSASNALALQKAKKGDDLKIPREMQGSKIGNLNSTIKDLDEHLTALGKGSQGLLGWAAKVSPRWSGLGNTEKTAEAARHVMVEKLASALGGGVASDARIKQADEIVPSPDDTPDLAKEKTEAAKQLLATQRDEYARQQGAVGYKVGPMAPLPSAPAKPKGFK